MDKLVESDSVPQTEVVGGNVTLVDTEKATQPLFWAPASDLREDNDVEASNVINDLFDRWTQVGQVELKSSQSVGHKLTTLDVPSMFSSAEYGESHMVAVLKSYQFVRGDVTLRFEVNANRFQIGKVLVAYYYGFDTDANLKLREDVWVCTSMPHSFIDIGSSIPVEIYIPYNFPTQYCRTFSNSYYVNKDFCRVYLYVLNPLSVADNTSSTCSISIFAKFSNTKVSGMLPRKRAATLIAEPEMMSVLKNALIGAAEGALGTFTDNRDYPRDPEPKNVIIPSQSQSWCLGTNQRLTTDIMRLDNLGCDPLLDSGEMKIKNLVQKSGMLCQFSWSVSDVTAHTIGFMPVHPSWGSTKRDAASTDKLALYYSSPISILASCFSYWRGGLIYTFDITASSFHNGRLSVAFYPAHSKDTLSRTERPSLHQVIFDLKDHHQFEYIVPFQYDQDFAKVSRLVYKNSSTEQPSEVVESAIGTIYLTVVNQLVAVEGISDYVNINVFIRGAPDFEFAIPTSSNLSPGWDKGFLVPSNDVKFRKGYSKVYVGYWRYWTGPILRYGTITDHIAQIQNGEFDVIYGGKNIASPDNTKWIKYYVCPHIKGDTARYLIPFSSLEKAKNYLINGTVETFSDDVGKYVEFGGEKFTIQYRSIKPEILQPINETFCPDRSHLTFGESCTDLKDFCRRFFSYCEDEFLVHSSVNYNETVFTLPLTFAGLDSNVDQRDSFNMLANYGRSGSLHLLASMFRYFVGGMRLRIVFECEERSLILAVTHIPDVSLVGYKPSKGISLGRKDSVLSGYAMSMQSVSINQVLDIEIPNYNPTQISFLQRTKLGHEGMNNLSQLYGLGNLCVSVIGRPKDNVLVNVHVFAAMADDSHFRGYCGPTKVANAREVPDLVEISSPRNAMQIENRSHDRQKGTVVLRNKRFHVDIHDGEPYINYGSHKPVDSSQTTMRYSRSEIIPEQDDILEKWTEIQNAIKDKFRISLRDIPDLKVEHEMIVNFADVGRQYGHYSGNRTFPAYNPAADPRAYIAPIPRGVEQAIPVGARVAAQCQNLFNSNVGAFAKRAAIIAGARAVDNLVPDIPYVKTGLRIAGALSLANTVCEFSRENWLMQAPVLVKDVNDIVGTIKAKVPVISELIDKTNSTLDVIKDYLPTRENYVFIRWIFQLFSFVKELMGGIGRAFVVGASMSYQKYKGFLTTVFKGLHSVSKILSAGLEDIIGYLVGENNEQSRFVKEVVSAYEVFLLTIQAFFFTLSGHDVAVQADLDELPEEDLGARLDDNLMAEIQDRIRHATAWMRGGIGGSAYIHNLHIVPESSFETGNQSNAYMYAQEKIAFSFSIFVAALCNLFKCKSSLLDIPKIMKELFTKIPTMARDASGILSFVTYNIDIIKDMLSRICGANIEGLLIEEEFDIEAFVQKACMLADPANRAFIELSPDLIQEVYNTKNTLDALLIRCKSAKLSAILRGLQARLEKTNAELLDECMTSPARYVPMSVCFEGKPGVGKSFITNTVARLLMAAIEFKCKGNLTYSRTIGNAYWQRLRNEPVVVYDDVMQVKGIFEQTQLSELIQLMSTQPFNPPVAEIEGKNKIYNPLLVMMTTNIAFPQITSMRDPKAFYRRRDVMYRVQLKKDYKNIHDVPAKILEKMDHVEFLRFRDPSDPQTVLEKPLSWSKMIEELSNIYRTYHEREKKLYAQRYEECSKQYGDVCFGDLKNIVEKNCAKSNFIDTVRKLVDVPTQMLAQHESGIAERAYAARASRRERLADCIHAVINCDWEYVPHAEDVECLEGEFINVAEIIPATICNNNCSIIQWQPQNYPKNYQPVQLIQPPNQRECRTIADTMKNALAVAKRKLLDAPIGVVLGALGAGAALLCSLVFLVKGYRALVGTSDVEAQSQDAVVGGAKKPARGAKLKMGLTKMKFLQPESEVTEDPKDILVRLVGRNCALLSFSDKGDLYTCRIVGVGGRAAMVMKHFFESWKFCNFPVMRLEIMGISHDIRLCESDFHNLTSSSIAMVFLPPSVPCFKDIRKHIATIDMHDYTGSKGLLIYKGANNVTNTELVPIQYMEDIDIASGVNCAPQALFGAYSYPQSGKGMCGTVLISLGNRPTIVGVHVAGAVNTKRGFAQIIAREMFEDLKLVSQIDVPTEDIPALVRPEHGVIDRGSLPYELRTHGPASSRLAELPTKGIFNDVLKEPSILSRKDPRCGNFDPFIEGIRKQSKVPYPFDRKQVQLARDDLSHKILSICKPVLAFHDELLTDQEIVCGIAGVQGYPGLKMSTSEGYPLVLERPSGAKAKEWLFEIDNVSDGKILKSIHPSLQEIRDHNEMLRGKGYACASIFSSSLKDELLLKEKIPIAGKTRMFSECPVELTMACKKYFGHFTASLCQNRIENEQCVGVNPVGPEWAQIVRKLGEVGTNTITGDYKAFGDSLEANCLKEALYISLDWYRQYYSDCTDFEYHQFMREVIIEEVLHCYRYCKGSLYQTFAGMPSGFLFTAEANSLVNGLYMRLAWLNIVKGKYNSLRYFNKFCRFLFYGDDLIGSISDAVIDLFNFSTIQHFLTSYNIVFTPEDKTSGAYVKKSLGECTFLSRGFVKHPKRPDEFLAPLQDKSIYPQLDYSWAVNNDQDAALVNCRGALRDMYSRGARQYEMLRSKMNSYWIDQSVHFQSDTWEHVDYEVFDYN